MERRKFLLNMASLGVLSMVKAEGVLAKTASSSDNFVIEQFEYKDWRISHMRSWLIAK